ncbi:MAG: hypothetical protein A3B17_02155 [Candidatus Yanofskybacteria bacterium RIFCSPLOWO2_01_FULL_45_72]|nr:MAG: hypothetical protein A3B17_02155 [Candidatus Yanofskybacteria bacterium RIFCSPLOWO2_01_FULL_45_72]
MLFKLAESVLFFMRQQLPKYSSKITSRSIQEKEPTEYTSIVDAKLNSSVFRFLKTIPSINGCPIISEEGFDGCWPPVNKNFWLIDPLDGTHNFIAGIPSFGSMIALIKNKNVIFSAVFIPAMEKMNGVGFYFAIKNKGAWRYRHDKIEKIRVSRQSDIKKCLVLFEGKGKKMISSDFVQKTTNAAERVRSSLSSGVSGVLVASGGNNPGGADALISFLNKPWDNLPGCLLVEEAGGTVTRFDGTHWSVENCENLVYSNGLLHKQILALA